ncbi:hypothetical protein MMC10_000955 [Thelotrema lepadinum]|nr:hypothetical protein [Thelotrema lepadinum]
MQEAAASHLSQLVYAKTDQSQAYKSKFIEGSMHDRHSACPPAHFLGKSEPLENITNEIQQSSKNVDTNFTGEASTENTKRIYAYGEVAATAVTNAWSNVNKLWWGETEAVVANPPEVEYDPSMASNSVKRRRERLKAALAKSHKKTDVITPTFDQTNDASVYGTANIASLRQPHQRPSYSYAQDRECTKSPAGSYKPIRQEWTKSASGSYEPVPKSAEVLPATYEPSSKSTEQPRVFYCDPGMGRYGFPHSTPNSTEVLPVSYEPIPKSPELLPAAYYAVSKSTELFPATWAPASKSTELPPASYYGSTPNSTEVLPVSYEPVPTSPDLLPAAYEAAPKSTELLPASYELAPKSTELLLMSYEPAPKSIEIAQEEPRKDDQSTPRDSGVEMVDLEMLETPVPKKSTIKFQPVSRNAFLDGTNEQSDKKPGFLTRPSMHSLKSVTSRFNLRARARPAVSEECTPTQPIASSSTKSGKSIQKKQSKISLSKHNKLNKKIESLERQLEKARAERVLMTTDDVKTDDEKTPTKKEKENSRTFTFGKKRKSEEVEVHQIGEESATHPSALKKRKSDLVELQPEMLQNSGDAPVPSASIPYRRFQKFQRSIIDKLHGFGLGKGRNKE